MLYQEELDDRLFFENTGYPYPNTDKSNYEMMKDLIEFKLGVEHDIEFYQQNWSKFKYLAMDKINAGYKFMTVQEIYRVLSRNNVPKYDSTALENSYICQISGSGDKYVVLYLYKPKYMPESDKLVKYLSHSYPMIGDIVETDLSSLIFIDRGRLEVNKDDYTALISYRKKYFVKSPKINRYVSDKLLEWFGLSFSSLQIVLNEIRVDGKLRNFFDNPITLNNSDVMNEFKYALLADYRYAKFEEMFNAFVIAYAQQEFKKINEDDYSEILLQGTKRGITNSNSLLYRTYASNPDSYFLSMLHYTVQYNNSDKFDWTKLDSSKRGLLEGSVETLVNRYINFAPRRYDKERRCWLIEKPAEIQSGKFDKLCKRYAVVGSSFSHEIRGFEPDIISDNEVVWDFNRYFDDKLSKVAVYILCGIRMVCYGDETSIDVGKDGNTEDILNLFNCVYDETDMVRALVFNGEQYKGLKDAVASWAVKVKYDLDGYYSNLPVELTEVFGEFNEFAKLLLLDHEMTASIRTNPKYDVEYSKEDNSAYLVLSYVLSIRDFDEGIAHTTRITNKQFKSFSGALLIDFLTSIIKDYVLENVGWEQKIELYEYDRLSINFNESNQQVTIRYRLS